MDTRSRAADRLPTQDGALEAVYVVDEVTSKYADAKLPLCMALVDISKAYDQTPSAFV
jgi:hypothetical protein